MTDLPQIRVGVDWDGDWEIAYDDAATDPLNLFPDSAILRDDQIVPVQGAAWLAVNDPNPFGQFSYYVDTNSVSGAGLKFSAKTHAWTDILFNGNPDTYRPGSLSLSQNTYTLSLYAKRVTGAAESLQIELFNKWWLIPGSEGYIDAKGKIYLTTTVAISTTWQRIDYTFTLPTGVDSNGKPYDYPAGLELRVTNPEAYGDFEISYRAALIVGATPLAKFNIGSLRLYDNVTSDVLSWQSRLGRANSEDLVPAEGTLSLTLNNFSRKYSPEYSGSPLYGLLKANRRVVVEVQRPSDSAWVILWEGFITDYDITPGGTSDGQAIIKASQGMFRLNKIIPACGILTNQRLNEVVDLLIPYGWQPALTPAGLSGKHYLDKSAVWVRLDDIRTFETGIDPFPVLGDGWGTSTTLSSILKEMLEVERGYFFISREGRLVFYNRHHYLDTTPVQDTFTLDTEANSATYIYGGQVNTSVEVTYFPKEYLTKEIWHTREPFEVAARGKGEFDIKFEYEEGTTVTVSSISPFIAPGTSTITANTKADGTGSASVKFTATVALKNGAATLTIINHAVVKLYFTVVLDGEVMVSFGGKTVTSIPAEGGVVADSLVDSERSELTFSNKLVVSETVAQQIGDYLLAKKGLPRSQFTSIKLASRDATWLERILDLTVGSYIQFSDYQTAGDMKLVVVGENHSWRPGNLTSTLVTVVNEPYEISTLTEDQTEFTAVY